MKVKEAQAALTELAGTIVGARAEVGAKGVPPYRPLYPNVTGIWRSVFGGYGVRSGFHGVHVNDGLR